MFQVRRSEERGAANRGWLKSYHSFSFGDYHDSKFMGFGPLRVINEDWVQAETGFGTHGHKDMEIITYMLSGELSHKDSLGGGSSIRPGQIQRMSAGTGIQHSEENRHKEEVAHLLQVWIEPAVKGVAPSYTDHTLNLSSITGRLGLIVTGDPLQAAELNLAFIYQDANVYAGRLSAQSVSQSIEPNRKAYLHVAKGELRVGELELQAGDALMIQNESHVVLEVPDFAEVLFFDLPTS